MDSGPPTSQSRWATVLGVLALVCSGVFQKWGSAPVNLWWLHLVGFVPALVVLSRLQGRRALLAGWLVGVAANASIFSWIIYTVETFSNLPWILAVGCLLLFSLAFGFYMAVFAWGFEPIVRIARGYWPLAIAAWFTVVEYLNPQLFPYYQGVTWYQVTPFFLVTGLTGVAGISFFLLLTNCILADLLLRRSRKEQALWDRPMLCNLGVWAGFIVVALSFSSYQSGRVAAAEDSAETVRIALVQANQDVFTRRDMEVKRQQTEKRLGIPRGERRSAITDDLVDLSLQAWQEHGDIDVFIWPEGAIRRSPASRRNRRVRELIEETGAELWTGGGLVRRDERGDRASFNSAFRVYPRGENRQMAADPSYDKNILLPFGEFMPLEDHFEFLRKIQGVGDFNAGDGLTVFRSPVADFVFLICYEAIRHRYVRGGVERGAELLVNITYDAWFGDTECPHQHLMLSVLQAAQFGLPLVRSATTGVSVVTDARGRILASSGVFERDVLVYDVKKARALTPYVRWGDWFAQGCGLAALALLLLGWRQRRPEGRRGWAAWCTVLGYGLFAPVLWPANPYTPWADWLLWGALMAVIVAIAWGWLAAARVGGTEPAAEGEA